MQPHCLHTGEAELCYNLSWRKISLSLSLYPYLNKGFEERFKVEKAIALVPEATELRSLVYITACDDVGLFCVQNLHSMKITKLGLFCW